MDNINNNTNDVNHFPNFLQAVGLSSILVMLSLMVGLIIELYFINNTLGPGIMIWINVPIFALTFIIGMFWSKKTLGYFIHQKFIPLATWIIIIFTNKRVKEITGQINF